jgi:hypothetical protein
VRFLYCDYLTKGTNQMTHFKTLLLATILCAANPMTESFASHKHQKEGDHVEYDGKEHKNLMQEAMDPNTNAERLLAIANELKKKNDISSAIKVYGLTFDKAAKTNDKLNANIAFSGLKGFSGQHNVTDIKAEGEDLYAARKEASKAAYLTVKIDITYNIHDKLSAAAYLRVLSIKFKEDGKFFEELGALSLAKEAYTHILTLTEIKDNQTEKLKVENLLKEVEKYYNELIPEIK